MDIYFSLDLCASSTNINNFDRRPITQAFLNWIFSNVKFMSKSIFLFIVQNIMDNIVQFLYLLQIIWHLIFH